MGETLKRVEIIGNFIIWISTALYSLYNVYLFGKGVDENPQFAGEFSPGWSSIGRSKDVSDYEWNSWKRFGFQTLPWIFVHSIVAETLRYNKKYLQLWYITISLTFITVRFGLALLIPMFIQFAAYYLVAKYRRSVRLVWACSCVFLIVTNYTKYRYVSNNDFERIDEDSFYLMFTAISWLQLRCISCALESIGKRRISFLDMSSYCLYLPLLFLGPVILYDDFHKSYSKPGHSFRRRCFNFTINMMRFAVWFIFVESALHFIYLNAMQFNLEILDMMPGWCFYGAGLWMGLYFQMKYTIVYRITSSFAAVDNIQPERPPICIARVHLYSQMWKYFDVGLHKFLIRYIYKPIMNNRSNIFLRFLASFVCFMFVFSWHGAYYFVFVWALLNFIGIVIEYTAAFASQYKPIKDAIYRILPDIDDRKRFYAFVATPLLILSALSNFYFFAGSEVGDLYVMRVLNQPFSNFAMLYFCLYSCCRVSQILYDVRTLNVLY